MGWFLLALLIGFFLLVLTLKIYLVLIYRHFQGTHRMVLAIYIWRYLLFRLRLPKQVAKFRTPWEKTQRPITKPFMRRMLQNYDYISQIINCEYFYWKTRYGHEDAAITGLAIGMIWAVKSLAMELMLQYIPLQRKAVLAVNPAFKEPVFHTELRCIFSLKLTHLIVAALKGILGAKEGKKHD